MTVEDHQPGDDGPAIEAFYLENRTFPPSDTFVKEALIRDDGLYQEAASDWEAFWATQATTLLDWFVPPQQTLQWDLPFAKWFDGGKLNVSYNCLDRHVAAGLGDRVAYHWEGEPGDRRTITYAELLSAVQKFANVLKSLGIAKGDRIAIYMPMIPELPIAMLACTRIGAPHSVVFGASRLMPCATGSSTPRPRCSSRPTAAGGGATRHSSSRRPMWPSLTLRPSPTWSSCAGPNPTSP